MGLKEHISKYTPYPTYTRIATEAYKAGLKEGREETKTDKFKKMEKELEELRLYRKSMEDTLYDPEKLAEFISGW